VHIVGGVYQVQLGAAWAYLENDVTVKLVLCHVRLQSQEGSQPRYISSSRARN
jgi:hypothetical protein